MDNPTDHLLHRYTDQRFPNLHLDENMILPGYGGYSIANVPASVCQWLGEEQWPTCPLAPEIHDLFNRQYRQVILVVMDGMGWNMMQRFGSETPFWQEVLDSGMLVPLTSIAPATTSSALTSFWTGRSPAQHGVTGYEMWLREYNLSANMITHTPALFEGMPGSLRYCGFNPETFLEAETLGPFLAKAGVQTSVLQSNNILGSGLSTMLFGGARQVPVRSLHDLFITLGHMANEKITDKRYIYVYWGNLDELQHVYGLDDGRVEEEYRVFQNAFTQFIRNLQKSANKDTLILLTADHGMTSTKPSPEYEIRRYPELLKKLHMLPAGESRLPYLYVRPGHVQAVKDEVRQIWKDDFTAIETSKAIESGLFGAPPFHPELDSRLGDLILISRGSSYLYWQIKENRLLGRHGGLSKEEMIVPLFMFES